MSMQAYVEGAAQKGYATIREQTETYCRTPLMDRCDFQPHEYLDHYDGPGIECSNPHVIDRLIDLLLTDTQYRFYVRRRNANAFYVLFKHPDCH